MFTREDSERLTRVGRGTPMGELMRRFWLPYLEASELPHPDCDPVRVKLLGEELVTFRDTNGRLGLLDTHCAHRNANLFFGRNEECGLRCTYHGWKYDVDGNCVDQPTEDEQHSYKEKIHLTAYPVREEGGVLWTYMGPKEQQPELPVFEWARVPENHRFVSWAVQECNYLQAVEGGIDSAHVNFLHAALDDYRREESSIIHGQETGNMADIYKWRDRHPKFFVKDTDYGLLIAARRNTGEDTHYWRFNNFLMPFYTTTPVGFSCHAFVPIDDENCARWTMTCDPKKPYTLREIEDMEMGRALGLHTEVYPGTHNPIRNKRNDYLIDRDAQRRLTLTGIKGQGDQDSSVQEQMGAITDWSHENLGNTDLGIIATRKLLLKATTELQEGTEPYAAQHGSVYHIRGAMRVLPQDAPWEEKALEAVTTLSG